MRAAAAVVMLAAWTAPAGAAGNAPAGNAPAMGPVQLYNLACEKSLAGDRDGAFVALDQAIAAGFGALDTMEKDPDLKRLREDARWKSTIERATAQNNPCKALPEARQLDFWVGEWDVHDPKGHLVGHSRIERIVNDCVVLENWSGSLGGNGKSINFWDKSNHRWQQTWVDNRGNVLQYTGRLVEGSMRYTADGKRLTFSPLSGGKVRQLAETSSDGGKTWSVGYDFTYSRHVAR
ncbi:MAG TPA: hypothetical protein VN947_26310 [Polyangia bacterium]|nr:hypothetical protein [Polyangia bacterium]